MQKKKVFSTRALVLASVCAALSVICGKLLQIPVGDSLRISFESLPVLFSSLVLGSLWGGMTGLVADLVGCAVMGYAVNPFVTLGAVFVGVLPALFSKAGKKKGFWGVFLPVLLTHAVGNMAVKSLGLYLYYGTPPVILVLRVIVYAVTATLESIILYKLISSPAIRGKKEENL